MCLIATEESDHILKSIFHNITPVNSYLKYASARFNRHKKLYKRGLFTALDLNSKSFKHGNNIK